jgi:SAM-dependent methyltransferase
MSFLKKHLLAWDREYTHLKWGGAASLKDIKTYLPPDSRILDAGSGNGRYLGELSKHYDAIGIDISLIALKNFKVQFTRNGRFIEQLWAGIHTLPFKVSVFDGILCYGVLQHLFKEEREAAAGEFKRVLRKGGFLFFEAFGCEDMRNERNTSISPEENTFLRQNGIVYHYFTKEEVSLLFKEFEVIKLEDITKEKNFRGKTYRRHMIRGVFRKT